MPILSDSELVYLSKFVRRCKASDVARAIDDESLKGGIILYDALCRLAINETRERMGQKPVTLRSLVENDCSCHD